MLAAGTKPTSGPVSAMSAIDPELHIAVLDINAKLANDWFVRVSIYIKAALFSAKEH